MPIERTFTIDSDLARRADRKLRRYGFKADDAVAYAFMLVVASRGRPDFIAPVPLDFIVDGVRMRKRLGASLNVVAGMTDGLHTVRVDAIGLDAFASTRAELATEVRAQLAMLWKEYALAADSELTESAQTVKRNLLASFEEAGNA